MIKTLPLLAGGATALALTFATAAYAQEDITTWDTASYATERLDVERFAGTLRVLADATGEMTVDAFGPAEKMDLLEIDTSGDTLRINYTQRDFRWNDWSTWLNWWNNNTFEVEDYPTVTIHLPVGSEIEIDHFTGDVEIGDTYGPISVRAAGALDGTIGNVTTAEIDIAGAADLTLGNIERTLEIQIAGAGDITTGDAAGADVSIHGAGDVTLGRIEGPLDISTAGAGDVSVAYLNGPADISIAGAGSVRIEDGRAEAFDVSIAGMGDVWFGGTAVDPDVSIAGMGDVFINAYEGRLSHSGMGDLEIGSGS